ncbi:MULTISPECIES: glycosyltransferase [Pseudomonas]|uniref:glycosyltransferase n=1 Tax=Pseudomonas nitroreducens TaxID=46680 RepID=UPI001E50E29D|nr:MULTISPECIES: glycosyltransferase [Pseudomonas]MCE4068988.1 glycosyltransferase [Pseudomonas nitritireducens]MCE4078177.1 glycosyltransferase [Pseudomonas nitroreducens]
MTYATNTGIVIVSFNAFEAVKATLSSVRRAHNESPFKLILVDNASEPNEQERIRELMADHIAEVGGDWQYIEQPENLGFSGGNNVGIRAFLDDPEITHVCLLNSDVIVTDHWLDRLLAYRKDIISSATNKADGEQCIPVDYEAHLSEFVASQSNEIPEAPYLRVQDFAERWNKAWKGNLVAADVTFFCVLLSRKALDDLGLLDETFFPGGFEDDDYCLRAIEGGYEIFLARDVYIHHWGSASFGKLQYEYFSARAQKNKSYLEAKHSITWKRRPEKPIVSFTSDIEFALKDGHPTPEQAVFLELHRAGLKHQITYFESEFSNLSEALKANADSAPQALLDQVAQARSYGNIQAFWQIAVDNLDAILTVGRDDGHKSQEIVGQLDRVALAIHERVDSNFAIHFFINGLATKTGSSKALPPPSSFAPSNPQGHGKLARMISLAQKGFQFIRQFNGVVFFGGYFYPERQSDGYFQRIQIVDRLFPNHWRVYVETEELRGRDTWFDRPEAGVIVLRVTGSRKHRAVARLFALAAALRCRKIYFHSVLRMYDNRFGKLLHLPFIRKAVDIHGVVPEEFRMHNDYFSALIYDKEERLAVKKAGLAIVVTNAMRQYLQQKFRDQLQARTVEFPMFPSFAPDVASRPLADGKPIVVYAGGLHKWQQVPKMIDAIMKTSDRCQHHFYCPEPSTVRAMLPEALLESVTVDAKPHAELMKIYAKCHYGFILREDIIVNRVACPTKLVEYLAMGIIPIVDCEDIGDFKALGMQFITLGDFLNSTLPSEAERAGMALVNLSVYEKLKQVRQTGAEQIYQYFTEPTSKAALLASAKSKVRRALPAHTRAGRLSRRAWAAIAPLLRTKAPQPAAPEALVQSELEKLPEQCDILVQVENFEAGGLENVVIDLNQTLSEASFRVVLLVLGNAGPAVEQARKHNLTVVCRKFDAASHASIIEHLKPRMVMGHYCNLGIENIHDRTIPFVQVLHNIYMWFNDVDRRRFAREATLTDSFIAVSEQVKNYSIARLGVAPEKCFVIHNGIDTSLFAKIDKSAERSRLRQQYGFHQENFVFLDVGAINHQKNHLGTLKAFSQVLKTCPDARLVILGPAYEKQLLQELQDYIASNGLQGKALYAGTAPGIQSYLAMADAFVSGTFFEGGPLTLLEALQANLPSVISNVGVASSFSGKRGVHLVSPAHEIKEYDGPIWEMQSSTAFEQRLTNAMIAVCQSPECPDLTEAEVIAIDRKASYGKYLELIAGIIGEAELVTVDLPTSQEAVLGSK